MKFKEDDRKLSWSFLEGEIQSRAKNKDPKFNIEGEWKEFVKLQSGFKIFAVDGNWIRNNLSVIFGHGGHGLVHEFIPMDEIWIAKSHFKKCIHKGWDESTPVTNEYFNLCIIHEIKEFEEMQKGMIYWEAHQLAIEEEKKSGILPEEEIGLNYTPYIIKN